MRFVFIVIGYLLIGSAVFFDGLRSAALSYQWLAIGLSGAVLPLLHLAANRKSKSILSVLLICLLFSLSCLSLLDWFVFEGSNAFLGELREAKVVVGLAVLFIEIRIVVSLTRSVYGNEVDTAKLSEENAIPEFMVKLMKSEADFWKAVWSKIKIDRG